MNVLVYSGPEVLQSSLTRSIVLLKSLLQPNYTVQAITSQSLSSQPWSVACALLVFPACRETLHLTQTLSNQIRNFVEEGGSLIGIRAGLRTSGGAILAPSEYTLRFSDKNSRSTVYFKTLPGGDEDLRNVSIVSPSLGTLEGMQGVETPEFSGIEKHSNIQALARYAEGGGVAGVSVRLGKGKAVFWGVHIENPVPPGEKTPEVVRAAARLRLDLVRETLRFLGLRLPSETSEVPPHPLPQLFTSIPSNPGIVQRILESLEIQPPATLDDANDTLLFHNSSDGLEILQNIRSQSHMKEDEKIKHVVIFPSGELPPPSASPLFNIERYYSRLSEARDKAKLSSEHPTWGIGEALLYGEVVTSTQTMLDRNHRFLASLPPPVLSLATYQLSGRGRGGNTWVSPLGCLQFSLVLRVPLSILPAQRLVFVQYLFALAVVEACRDEGVLGNQLGADVRIKWPNDVYIITKDGSEKRKVGGILVHTSFLGGIVTIIIGCGLNVSNPLPIASLSQLVPKGAPLSLSIERTAAVLMSTFEPMWDRFLASNGRFDAFMDLYLDRWLHSDQLVTVTTTTPHRKVRVVGLTDHGLLRTIPEGGSHVVGVGYRAEPGYIDLQPDGNSFDLMSGLIMTKT